MSDSVVPTPSEKPTCEHGWMQSHRAVVGICDDRSGTVATFDCPGPVISTEPETPSYIPNLSTDGQQKPCDARCGHNNHRIGCLNDPVPDAMCEVHLEKDGRLRVTAWVRPDQMYATLSALQSTASDPTPELRERLETIAGYHDPHDSEGTQWCRACGTCFPCVTRVELDAVLDELGEPK